MTHSGACSFSVASLNAYKFSGKERDSESNLDHFGARHYASALGRFGATDPSRQSLNPNNATSAGTGANNADNAIAEDAARQCALGNRAACD